MASINLINTLASIPSTSVFPRQRQCHFPRSTSAFQRRDISFSGRFGGASSTVVLAFSGLSSDSIPHGNGTYKVGDFMTKKENLHVVKTTTTVDEALEILVENRISGLPVIDDGWNLVGVVSDYDLLAIDSISGGSQCDTNLFPEVDSSWKTFHRIQKLLSKTNGKVVGDLMTPTPLVVNESTNLEEAARMLLETKYGRLPVVDDDGKLVGLITRGTIVRAALRAKRADSWQLAMDAKNAPVEMFFFPFVGGGHQIPMIDTARVFAAHGAKSTIITTLFNALQFQKSITRDQQSGLAISVHTITLPENADITDIDMSASPFTDTSILREPFRHFLAQYRPDCIVIDMFHRWAAEVIDELHIKRVVFNGNGCFPRCVHDNLRRYNPQEKVGSDSEPFIVPSLPDRIQMTRSQLPIFFRQPSGFPDRLKNTEENSFGTVINSFYELEPSYANYFRNEMGKKVWIIGPVSLCNRNAADKTERGKLSTIEEQSCLDWLNSKQPNSVVYISFGSLARLPPQQLMEIAYALEASDQSFIWVVGKILNSSEKEETWLPSGFEERIKKSKKGLIIRGWAPQLLILEHGAVGGFMTHCGWNSTLEGLSAGKPMITWPLSAEQFSNEKLITDVLRIGVKVGSEEWASWDKERQTLVGRAKVEVALKNLMGKTEEAEEMRRRVKDIAGKAKRAVEQGGTSYADADALIQELKAHRQGQS